MSRHKHAYIGASGACVICGCLKPLPGARPTAGNSWPGWDRWVDFHGKVHHLSVDGWCAEHSGKGGGPVYCSRQPVNGREH